jgi:hypothetical protein
MAFSWYPWFSSSLLNNRSSHHANNSAIVFKNPWPSAKVLILAKLLQAKFLLGYYKDLAKKYPEIKDILVIMPD